MPRPRILAIDDTPVNLRALGAGLSHEFDLQIATSGAQGLALARQRAPDLILLDVMMPELDGYQVFQQMKASAELSAVPVIFVTALKDYEAEHRALQLGAADYLSKPLNVELARHRIRNLLERERLRKEVESYRDTLEARVEERTRELSIAKEAADAASRAKSDFLSMMSHEIRTPMNAIIGLAYLLRRQATDPANIAKLDTINGAAGHLLSIINDILDFSKIEAGKLTLEEQDLDLAALVRDVAAWVSEQARSKELELHVEIDEADFALRGDVTRLKQAILNLANNALKFTDSGSVTLRVMKTGQSAQSADIRIEVTDTGIGIAPEVLPTLFAPFQQGRSKMNRSVGGTGLGLAITRRLALLMGGQTGVESAVGVGSTFWFTAQLDKAHGTTFGPGAAACAKTPETILLRDFSETSVLLVDDDPINREVGFALLESVGLSVDLACDGVQAVEKIRQSGSQHYGLVLMDLRMPRLDGLEAARQIVSLPGVHVPIIAMTADASGEERERCIAAGMVDFISKPVDTQVLYRKVLQRLREGARRALLT